MDPATQVATVPAVPSPTPEPPRVLTICMGSEPGSLFLYGDSSTAARSVREAVYDGPLDRLNFDSSPVILEKKPALADGDAVLEPVQVSPGALIVDAQGNLVTLEEGTSYLPSGCAGPDCAQAYTGQEPVLIDRLVVRFRLKPGLLWSDGAPLTADDSLYSFELASSYYPKVRADLISRTDSYTAPDASTLEWRGLPGFRDPRYPSNFFTPLPRHAWGNLSPEELLTSPLSTQAPIGWGAYKIDEWTAGDHISLSRNPNYFRSSEGLPRFDHLVFRFMSGAGEALEAFQAGECDYLDETILLETRTAQLLELQNAGQALVSFETGTAWEHADFGIVSAQAAEAGGIPAPSLFQLKETRQAVAMCIDRQSMAEELFFGQSQVPLTYAPPQHPLQNPDARRYSFDPQAASALLEAAGWIDGDNDPETPRVALGVQGVPDGTPFVFTYLTTDEAEKQRAAQMIQSSLSQCGIQIVIDSRPFDQLMAPGPEGPVFGRNFAMAQFGWVTALEPPCFLYTSAEIPGPYPDFPKGWGGANASGYSSPAYDQACRQALSSLPDSPEHRQAHFLAQSIFAEDLPALPLYLHLKLVVMRPDLCNASVDPSAESSLWNLELYDYGKGCPE